ncbi:MAG: AAA family ATPase, partial [Candidatus Binatia bacterium]
NNPTAPRRHGALAVIQGEAGVGKSTLVRSAIDHAHGAGVDVECVACEAVQFSSTYAAWAKVLVRLLDLDVCDSAEQRTTHVLAALAAAGISADLAPLVGPILDAAIEENDTTREMSGQVRGDNLLALLARLLTHLTDTRRGGLFLILEDVHWLDAASWELLGVLTRGLDTHPLGILLTLRSEAVLAGSHWHAIVTAPEAERITVAPLSLVETRDLARRLLHAGEISQQLANLTYDRTRGNPFFCEQLLSALVESGIVGVESGVASLRIRNPEQAESLVPRSVAAVVTSRLDRLPAPVQLTLKAASVVGARFRLDVLRALHPMQLDEQTLLAHLDGAADLGLVEKDDLVPGAHRFRHAITCDVAYGLLLVSQRRQLHREVAEYLSRDSESPAAQAVLFYHWRRSGDEVRALRHVDHAGAEAMRNGNYHAVTELYGYALQTLAAQTDESAVPSERGKPPREALWSGHLGEAQVAIGLHEAARSNLELCLETLGESAPGGSFALALAVGREAIRQTFHRLLRRRFEGSRAGDAERLALAADTHEQLGFVYYSAGETLRGLHAALRILNLSELAGLPDRMARSYAVMSLTAAVVGLKRLAELYDRRAVRLARETDDVGAQAYVGWVTGIRAAGEARWDLVTMRVEAALQQSAQSGDRRLQTMSLQTLVWPPYVRGDFSRVVELGEAQLSLARESNNRLWEAWALNGLSEAALMLGDYATVTRNCQRALEVLSEESDRADEIRALGLLAVSLQRQSRGEEAMAVARRGLDLMTNTEMTSFAMFEGFAGVCEVLLTFAEETKTRAHSLPSTMQRDLRRAVAAFARFCKTFPLGRPRLHAIRARIAALESNAAVVGREFNRALRSADDLGMPHEKGLALLAAARCEVLDGESRRRRVEEAVGVLRSGEALKQARDLLREETR